MEHRDIDDRARDRHRVHGLARNLTEIFARHKALRAMILRNRLRDAHHKPAHDDGEILLAAIVADGLLHLCKADHIDRHPPAVAGHEARKLQNLFLRALGGVGVREEMNALNFYAALGDHVASDRRVDTARQQHRRTSARTCGKTARAGNGGTVDIGRCLADLDVHNVGGIMDIDRDVREFFCDPAADFLGDLDGVEGEALVRALGLDLEALLHGKLVSEVLYDSLENRVEVLFAGAAAAHRRDTENRAAGLPCAV